MVKQKRKSILPPKEVFLQQTRDALIFFELISDQPIRVELRGIVTKVRHHGGIIFFNFEDSTAKIQLIAQHNNFNDSEWNAICHFKPSDRIIAQGMMSRSKTGEASVLLCKVLPVEENVDAGNENRTVKSLDRIGVRLFLARLRYKAEAYFRNNNFLQIEPNFISTTWIISGIEPLRVQYEGFGVPTYLTPSPGPQLVAAMEGTGVERVFAVSRCFTTTYRDETTSAESLILMAKISHSSLDELIDISQKALIAILGDIETMPDNYQTLISNGWRQIILSAPPIPGSLDISTPTFQIYELQKEKSSSLNTQFDEITILRACWPPKHVLVEGSLRKISGRFGVGTLTIFLERTVPLLKDVSVRQLGDLQRAID